jgi:cytochrome c-type biogenesis protein CcmH
MPSRKALALVAVLGWIATAAVPALARAHRIKLAPAAAVTAPRVRTSVQEVSEGLTCQCGCGLTVANCNHPQCSFSVPIREQIEAMVQRGMSRGEILLVFRHKYGEKILSAPTTEGFNLLAWTMPFAAIFAGVVLILITLGRWRSSAAPAPAISPVREEMDPHLKEALEREVRERI